MAHLSYEQLTEALKQATACVTVGAQYRHYKHSDELYAVTGLAVLEDSNEVAVLYRGGQGVTFAQPLSRWCAEVSWQGQTVPRFTKAETV